MSNVFSLILYIVNFYPIHDCMVFAGENPWKTRLAKYVIRQEDYRQILRNLHSPWKQYTGKQHRILPDWNNIPDKQTGIVFMKGDAAWIMSRLPQLIT